MTTNTISGKPGLNVNIDHVATLRQARLGNHPDPVFAAYICEISGANGIVAHLREDRRHIQDRDIKLLRDTIKTKLNLEMAPTVEMTSLAVSIVPDMVTIVPEKRRELTTEGGYDVKKNLHKIKDIIEVFKSKEIITSLFIDPDEKQIESSAKSGAEMVEIHTGKYSGLNNDIHKQEIELSKIIKSVNFAMESGLRVSAGHGLDYNNVSHIAGINGIKELNIGYSIICRAMITGLEKAVKDMISLL